MFHIHPHGLHHLDRRHLLVEGRKELFLHILIRGLGVSLLSFFIPIYLLKIGFSLTEVFIYLLIKWGCFGLLAPAAAKMIQKIGIKEMLIIRIPLFILVLASVIFLENNPSLPLLYVLAAVYGFVVLVYWLSVESLFARFLGERHKGEKTSKYFALHKIAEVAGPIIAGLVALEIGFTILFIIIAFIMFVSVIPLFFLNKNLDHPKFTFLAFKKFKQNFRDFKFLILKGFEGALVTIVLPIIIFLNNLNVFEIGILMAMVSLLSFLSAFKVGKLSDALGLRKVIRLGAVLCAICLGLMGYFVNSVTFVVLALVFGALSVLIDLPYETYLFVKAKRFKSPMEYVVFKQMSVALGKVILFGLLMFLSYKFDLIFYIDSIGSLMFALF
ncbi:MAG: MFS transporter [Candidatus Nanoarchaeia archaeon]|nr:MFS transporter [Candidatus Nanoarchaeia archaeon]